jgi:membrane associated rhomboid family serine protease
MNQLTDVVKQLLIINVIVFVAQQLMNLNFGILYFPGSEHFMPFQFITYMFLHGSIGHIFFNMYALAMFGPSLEAYMGPKRFLFYYIMCGLGAAVLQILVWWVIAGYQTDLPYSMLGASGAVFGLLAAFGIYFGRTRMMLLIPPVELEARYMVLIYAGLELFLGVGGYNTGVAHFAHLGGAIMGLLLIFYWRKFGH